MEYFQGGLASICWLCAFSSFRCIHQKKKLVVITYLGTLRWISRREVIFAKRHCYEVEIRSRFRRRAPKCNCWAMIFCQLADTYWYLDGGAVSLKTNIKCFRSSCLGPNLYAGGSTLCAGCGTLVLRLDCEGGCFQFSKQQLFLKLRFELGSCCSKGLSFLRFRSLSLIASSLGSTSHGKNMRTSVKMAESWSTLQAERKKMVTLRTKVKDPLW